MAPYEEKLLGALRETLGDEPGLSTQTNFAELGLDSLTGLRFLRKAQNALGVEIDLEWLFDHPSVAELACFLHERYGSPDNSAVA
jgi:acyl carrier protein